MDKPRANTATAHKLARMLYFMLTRGEDFVDQEQPRYEVQQRQRRIASLTRRAGARADYAVGILAGERGSMLALRPPLKLVTSKPFCAKMREAK